MARKVMKAMRYEEIQRLINNGCSNNFISKSLKCSRKTVREIRNGKVAHPEKEKIIPEPPWALTLSWDEIKREIALGYPIKYIWQEKAVEKISYTVFWKYFYNKFPELKSGVVTHRAFKPGEYAEVDWAGSKVSWTDPISKKEFYAHIFIGTLCFSQLIFATACENEKSASFLESHRKMFEYFGGVPEVIVPDCLKTGVKKVNTYDPDINDSYAELIKHYNSAVVPARVRHPKDKALVEAAVKLVMRLFKWKFRNYKFSSLTQINNALAEIINEINSKKHTKFKVSRFERLKNLEKESLKSLPLEPYQYIEWKEAKVHPDSHISIKSCYYSVPHIYRGQTVKVKISRYQIEVYINLERIAVHKRNRDKACVYITDVKHLPDNSKAYYEATPKNILAQAKYISHDLYEVLDGLFQENTLSNLRRAQGFIREAKNEINFSGNNQGNENIKKACDMMVRFNKIRTPYFKQLLKHFRKEKIIFEDRNIHRNPGNPMLRILDINKLKEEEKKHVTCTD